MRIDNCPFDKKTFWRYAALLALVCVLHKVTGGDSFALFAPVAVASVATGKREQSFFWILVTISMLIANANLFPKSMIFAMSQRAAMCLLGCLGFLRLAGKRKSPQVAPLLWLIPYTLYMIVPSLFGWMPVISGLKLFLFAMVFLGYFAVANDIAMSRKCDVRKLRAIMLLFACFFVFGSMILSRMPAYGNYDPVRAELEGLVGPSLFMGMTMNPQCLGPTIAIIAVLLFCDLVFGVKRWHPLYVSLLACTPYLVFLTSSRTGMATFILGLSIAAWMFMRSRGVGLTNNWKSRVTSGIMSLVLVLAIIVIAVPRVQQGILNYALKWGGGEATAADFSIQRMMTTRQGLIDRAIYNFRQSPLIGNGFQVSDEMQYLTISDWRQLLTAPVEKGVWVVAILEEGGIIGMGLFLLFILCAYSGLKRAKAYTAISCLATMLLTNMGEFTFFSMSYSGGFQMGVLFAAAVLDSARMRQLAEAQNRMVYIHNVPVRYAPVGS